MSVTPLAGTGSTSDFSLNLIIYIYIFSTFTGLKLIPIHTRTTYRRSRVAGGQSSARDGIYSPRGSKRPAGPFVTPLNVNVMLRYNVHTFTG